MSEMNKISKTDEINEINEMGKMSNEQDKNNIKEENLDKVNGGQPPYPWLGKDSTGDLYGRL